MGVTIPKNYFERHLLETMTIRVTDSMDKALFRSVQTASVQADLLCAIVPWATVVAQLTYSVTRFRCANLIRVRGNFETRTNGSTLSKLLLLSTPVQGVMSAVADVDANFAEGRLKYWVPCVALHVISRLCATHDA